MVHAYVEAVCYSAFQTFRQSAFVKEMKIQSILLKYNMTFRKTNLTPFLKSIQTVSNHPDFQI